MSSEQSEGLAALQHKFECWAVQSQTFVLIPTAKQVIEKMESGEYLYRCVQQAWEAVQAMVEFQ